MAPKTSGGKVYSTAPINRNHDFVKRGVILDQVRDLCINHAGWVVLYGPEGVGKTSLALEFAHTLLREDQISVFWIDASSPARYEEGLRAIAEACQIPGRNVAVDELGLIVGHWLDTFGEPNKVKWCLIIDGAEDYDFLLCQPNSYKYLHRRFYDHGNGCVLATTRNKQVAHYIGPTRNVVLEVGYMTKKEALALYQIMTNAPPESKTWEMAGELVEQLEYRPAAIARAAISRRAQPRMNQEKFLSTKNIQEILRSKSPITQSPVSKLTDRTTWDAVINLVERKTPSAASLLYLMSFFSDCPIPASLLQLQGSPLDPEAQAVLEDPPAENPWDQEESAQYDSLEIEFRRDSRVLLERFLITWDEENDTWEMHHAVQLAVRKRLETKGEFVRYSQEYVAKLARALPKPNYIHFQRVRQLWRHFEKVLDYPQRDDPCNLQRATVLHNGSWLAMVTGQFEIALKLIQEAVPIREEILGDNHDMTLESLNQKGMLLCYVNNTAEALKVQEAAYDTSRAALGKEHHVTLEALMHLVPVYWCLNREKEALDVMEDVVEARKRVFGEDDEETMSCIGLLAHIYWVLQRLDDSEKLAGPLLESRISLYGPDHPRTLSITNTLGSVYCNQGRYKEAKELLEPAVERIKRVAGEHHTDTLCMVLNLALVEAHLGNWTKVHQVEEAVMYIFQVEAKSSFDPPVVAYNRLLKLRSLSCKPEEIMSALMRLEYVIKRALGERSYEMISCLETQGKMLNKQDQPGQAEKAEAKALKICRDLAGENNHLTMMLMDSLANTQYRLGRKQDALCLMRECVEARQRILGPEHTDTLQSLASLEEWERSMQRRSWFSKLKGFKKGT